MNDLNSIPQVSPPNREEDEYYKVYEEYAKSLRTWLVAYGIGGPVLLLTNDGVRNTIISSGWARCITVCYLAGVGIQVLLTALNKTVMWALYYGEIDDAYKTTRLYKAATWVAGKYWIDLIADVASLVLFAWATFSVFNAITTPQPSPYQDVSL